MRHLLQNQQSPRTRALVSAVFSAGTFAALAFLLQLGSPSYVLAASLLMGLLGAYTTYRLARGRPMVPYTAAVVFCLAALAFYTWIFLVHSRPSGIEWIYVPPIFLFPLGLLYWVYREKVDRRRNPSEHDRHD
ncbi:MAG TPA: hypothetical protein VGR37_01940 [Longimicrobiaceae bacterium]|nr:hypothetical protein [Longimicrobiaceae bacterium]